MTTIGLIVFYLGFLAFFVGVGALIKGDLQLLRIKNRKEALILILLSFVMAFVGLIIIGPGHSV